MEVLSPQAIIERLKTITGDRFDSDLATRIGVDKQSFPQYKNKKTVDLQQRMICLLLSKIEELDFHTTPTDSTTTKTITTNSKHSQ